MNVVIRHRPSFTVGRVHLEPGEQIKVESGAMMSMSAGVEVCLIPTQTSTT